jgi:hypothetical protein
VKVLEETDPSECPGFEGSTVLQSTFEYLEDYALLLYI